MTVQAFAAANNSQRDRCLRIEVTSRCNNTCKHCFARAEIAQYSDLPTALVQALINEGRQCGYDQLHLTGGEPVMWPGLFKSLTHAVQAGYDSIFLNTNGSLLTERVARRLATYDNLSVSVSLDGPRCFQDPIRGKSSFQRAVKGIQAALDANIKTYIFTIVRKSLLPHLPRFTGSVFQCFPSIQGLTLIQLIRVAGDAHDLGDELLSPEQFIATIKTTALLNRYGCRVDFLNNPLADLSAKLMGLTWIPKSRPLVRNGSICLLASKKITLSHSSRDSFGTYVPGSLSAILSTQKYADAVAPDRELCPKCKFIDRCRSNGMVQPTEWYRSSQTLKPFCRSVLDLIESRDGENRQISLD